MTLLTKWINAAGRDEFKDMAPIQKHPIKVTCKKCSFSEKIPIDRIPPNIKKIICPKCQTELDFESVRLNDLSSKLSVLKNECILHGFSEQAGRVSQRIRDLNEPLLVMVVGEGNFGKSTLINALIGKDIAPVSILPKTWKVDLYEADQYEEAAWLYMREAPDKPQKVSISEATKICEQEENNAKSMKDKGHSWKSDLFQVRWSIKADWPQQKAALVDTPGFSQLRADTSVSDIKLYGGNGIQLAASDAFEYYYYRADIVLWCINGNKVQDQDTLEALAKVHAQDKVIIGVLTKMDRIPDDRWPEIQHEAQKTFGKYINEFVCTAAGAKSDIKQQTISNLRDIIDNKFINNSAKYNSVSKYISEEVNVLANCVDVIMDCYEKNIATRIKLASSISNNIVKAFDTAIIEVESAWKAIESSSVVKLDEFYDRCNGDVEHFRELVSESCIDTYEINNKVSRVLAATRDRTDAEIQVAISKIVWDGVLIGGTKVEPLQINDTSIIKLSADFKTSGVMSINFTGSEGVGVGLATGGAAAAISMFVLGPIGILGGLLGLFIGAAKKKSDCISAAKSEILNFIGKNKESVVSMCNNCKKQYVDMLDKHLENSFICHHGKNYNEIIRHILDADSTVNNLGCLPQKTRYLIPVGIYSKFKLADLNSNKWSIYYYNNGAGEDWDGAVVDEWKKSTIPVLIKRLAETSTTPFHVKNLENIKSEFLNDVRKEIICRVTGSDWSSTENGLTISVSDIILSSGASEKIKGMLPSANEIITGTANSRLNELKHHDLNMKEHFTKTYNSSMSTLVSNFSESIVVMHPRYAMMAMLAVALLVYCSRYVDTTWIKIVFQCGGVIGIWSIYCNNYKQDNFLAYYMMTSLTLILSTIWYFNIVLSYLLFLPAAMLIIYMIFAYVNLYGLAREESNVVFDKYINKLNTESMQLINEGLSL